MRRFSALTWLQALWPGLAQQFGTVVPEEFWTQEVWDGSESDRVAVVSCPCGGEPRVGQNAVEICPGKCGRAFILLGEELKVAKWEPEDMFSPEELADPPESTD